MGADVYIATDREARVFYKEAIYEIKEEAEGWWQW